MMRSYNPPQQSQEDTADDSQLLFNIAGAIACIGFVGLLSSMFLGLLTLDPLDLKIKQSAAIDPQEKEYAARLLPIVEQYHRLLVTLLLLNSLAYEALPLFLDQLLPTWATICLSVTFLLVFGEIIPSAIFTGPDQLRLASSLVPLVRFFLVIMYPVAILLVKLLDYLVPEEDPNEVRYHRGELSALVRIQYEQREASKYAQNQKKRQQMQNLQKKERLMKNQSKKRKRHKNSSSQRQWLPLGFGLKGRGGTTVDEDSDNRSSSRSSSNSGSSSSISIGSDRARDSVTEAYASRPRSARNTTIKRTFYKSNATWRNFKREILEAVQERSQSVSQDGAMATTAEDLESLARNVRMNLLPPPLESTEIQVVQGALNMKTKVAMDVYTPIRNMFAVPSDMVLNKTNITTIYGNGYSRVPVYEPETEDDADASSYGTFLTHLSRVKGVLMTRQLILIDWDDERRVDTLPIQIPPCVSPRMNLVDLLHLLQSGGSLMAFVCARPDVASHAMEEGRAIPSEGGFMGLVTLEDVLESILQERILDEIDVTHRTLASARLSHWAATVLQRFVKKKQRGEKKKRDSDTGNSYDKNRNIHERPSFGQPGGMENQHGRDGDIEEASETTNLLNGNSNKKFSSS